MTDLATRNRFPLALSLLAAISLTIPSTVTAQGFNAGDSTTTPTAPSAMGDFLRGLNPANWKMPSFGALLPGEDEQDRIVEKKDSLFTEVRKSASNSWQRTKNAFAPITKLNPVPAMMASDRKPVESPKAKKPGFFKSLFSLPKANDGPATTTTDFLRQDRPGR